MMLPSVGGYADLGNVGLRYWVLKVFVNGSCAGWPDYDNVSVAAHAGIAPKTQWKRP
jgi:hypothetical protein